MPFERLLIASQKQSTKSQSRLLLEFGNRKAFESATYMRNRPQSDSRFQFEWRSGGDLTLNAGTLSAERTTD